MQSFVSIAKNTFLQTIRQPIFGLVTFGIFVALVVSVPLSGWTMSTDYETSDQRMLETIGLSTILFGGLLVAAFSASATISREIQDKTALTVISKPVSRPVFLLGKFAGVSLAVGLAYYLMSLAFLLTVRHQVVSAASSPIDWPVIVIGVTAFVLALLVAGGGNYLFGWQTMSAAVVGMTVALSIALVVVLFVGKGWTVVPPGYDQPPTPERDRLELTPQPGQADTVRQRARERGFLPQPTRPGEDRVIVDVDDMEMNDAERIARQLPGVASVSRVYPARVIRASLMVALLLMFLAVWVLTGVAVAGSTRLGQVLTLLLCLGFLAVGSMHPWLMSQLADRTGEGNPAVTVLGWCLPNLTVFYPQDRLAAEVAVPWSLLGMGLLYAVGYVGAVLAVGVALFQGRNLQADVSSSTLPGLVNLLSGGGRIAGGVLLLGALVLLARPGGLTGGNLLACGLMVLVSAGLWVLFRCFGLGKRWAYWTTLMLAAGVVVWGGWILGDLPGAVGLRADLPRSTVLLGSVLAGCVLVSVLLPKTRRHFKSV